MTLLLLTKTQHLQMSVLMLMPHNNNQKGVTYSLLTQCSLKKQSLSFTSFYILFNQLFLLASKFCISLFIWATTAVFSFSLYLFLALFHPVAKNLINLICTHTFSRISSVKQGEREIDFIISLSRGENHNECLCVKTFFLGRSSKTYGLETATLTKGFVLLFMFLIKYECTWMHECDGHT